MKPASGNINDMERFKASVKSHIKSLKAAQSCDYLVADAALYVKETCGYFFRFALTHHTLKEKLSQVLGLRTVFKVF